MIPTEYTKPLTEEKFDTLSIPYFVVKKRSRHGADCGKTDALREYHQARHCFTKALKICSILERFQKHDTYRESQHAVGWTEDTCRRLDQIAKEEKSYIATWSERQRYENNWKLALNAQGSIAPMTEREDYFEAIKTIKDCATEDKQESFHPILPSHQTRQRPFQAMDMEYLIRVIFVLVGMDTIAILVDLFKIVRTTNEFDFLFLRGVSITGNGDSFASDRACQQYTAPRTFHTRAQFSRAWRKAQVAAISLSQQQSFSRACYVSHFA